MNNQTSFLKRCLAMALALVLLVSNANLGMALKAFADESTTVTVSDAEILTKVYSLTDAEIALLKSGLFVSDSNTYSVPTEADNLISVDTDTKTVTVKSYEDKTGNATWNPVTVQIVVGEEVKETVTMTEGTGTYTGDYAAFSVKVDYVVTKEIAVETQAALLGVGEYFVTGTGMLETANDDSAPLATYEMANSKLVQLAEGMGPMNLLKLQSDEAIASVEALDAQIQASEDGELELTVMLDGDTSAEALLKNGAAVKAKLVETYNHINTIMSDKVFETLSNDEHELTKQFKESDPDTKKLFDTFVKQMKGWLKDMKPVVEAEWFTMETLPLKAEMTAEEYVVLNDLVEALDGTYSSNVPTAEVVAASTSVKLDMAMSNVTIKLSMQAVNEKNELVTVGTYDDKVVTLAEGTAKADVLAAIAATGVEAAAVESWKEVGYVAEGYEATYTELPAALSGDVDYVITYAPKDMAVTVDGEATAYPYGYNLTLVEAEEGYEYDYTVNGEYVAQGTTIVIVGETVITTSKNASRSYTTLVENVTGLTEQEKAILDAEAVTAGKNEFGIRYPADSKVALKDNKVTAEVVDSGYNGKTGYNWIPASAKVYADGEIVEIKPLTADNGYSAVITNNNYDSVVVNYALTLADQDAGALKNLPFALREEAVLQLSRLDRLATKEDDLMQVKFIILNTAATFAEKPATVQAMNNLLGKCFTENGKDMDLYLQIKSYPDDGSAEDRLFFYMTNRDAISAQLETIVPSLEVIAADQAFKDACKEGIGQQAVDAINQLDEISAQLKEISLPAPNAAINTESSALLDLCKLLTAEVAEGEVNAHEAETLVMSHEVTKAAPGKVTISVTLKNGTASKTITQTVNQNAALNAEKFTAAFEAAVAELGITDANAKHYNHKDNLAEFEVIVGSTYDANKTATLTWTPNVYPVERLDEEGNKVVLGEIKLGSTSIVLPSHPDSAEGWEYVYTVDGETKAQGTAVTIDLEDLSKPEITWEAKNVKLEDAENSLRDFIIMLNANGPQTGVIVELSEDEKTMTMSVDVGASQGELMAGMGNFVNALTFHIGSVTLNDKALLDTEDVPQEDGPPVPTAYFYLQGFIDALLYDEEFNNASMVAALGADRAPLLEGEMILNGFKKVNFELKLTGTKSQLNTLSAYLAAVSPYVQFQANNGQLDLVVNLPEKVYELYLAALVAGEVRTFDNLNEMNTYIGTMFLYDYMMGIVNNPEFTIETLQNTLELIDEAAFDKVPDYDLTQFEARFEQVRKVLQENAVITEVETEDGQNYPALHLDAPAKPLFDTAISAANMGAQANMLKMVAEYAKGESLIADATLVLTNTATDFEALVIDGAALKNGTIDLLKNPTKETLVGLVKGEGVANGIDFTTDLNARMAESGPALVMLVNDVPGDLVINRATILDLNGFDIKGDLTAKGNTFVFDSSVSTYNAGTVYGTASGNLHLAAGNYAGDVSAYTIAGYKQEGTTVRNIMFAVESDDELNRTYVINTNMFEEGELSKAFLSRFALTLSAEVTMDLALNHYLAAHLSVDGNKIFGYDFTDLLDLMANSSAEDLVNEVFSITSMEGTAAVINTITADLLDFDAIQSAVANGEEVASYTLTTAPWGLYVYTPEDGNYVTVGIGSQASRGKTYSVGLKLEGTKTDEIAEMAGIMHNVMPEARVELVNVQDLHYNDRTFTIGGGIEADINIDLSDYTTYLAIAIANAIEDNAELIDAVNTGDLIDLKDEIDVITVEDIYNALKVLNRDDSFAELAKAVGITAPTANNGRVEKALIYFLSAAGKALEKLDASGREVALKYLDYARKAVEKADAAVNEKVVPNLDKAVEALEKRDISLRVDILSYVDAAINALEKAEATVAGKALTYLKAARNAVENFDTSFMGKALGNLDADGDGIYEIGGYADNTSDVSLKGFTAVGTASVEADLHVNIFGKDLFHISFANMTLQNSLQMNFAFKQSYAEDWTGYYAEIVKTYADGRPDDVQIDKFEDWDAMQYPTLDGVLEDYWYVSFYGIAAKEMTDELYVTIYNAEGKPVSYTWIDSVRDYSHRILAKPESTDKTITMIVDMLNYGAGAQNMFQFATDDLANALLTADQKAMATETMKDVADTSVSGENHIGSSLTLETEILLNLAFKKGAEGMTATYSYTDHYGHDYEGAADLWLDGKFAIVDIDEIAVADLRQPVTVTVLNADGTVHGTVTESAETYIARMLEKDPLYELIMKFGDSAHAFFHG